MQKHSYLEAVKVLREWSVLADNTKKLRKSKHKKDTKSKYLTLQKFKQMVACKRFKQARLDYVKIHRDKNLLSRAFTCFERAIEKMRIKLNSC